MIRVKVPLIIGGQCMKIMDLLSFFTNMGWISFICFIFGLGLVIFEMFAPGFGIPGISGTVLILLGVVLTAKSILQAVIIIIVIFTLLGIIFAIILRSAATGRLSKTLILSDSMKKESGYIGTEDLELFLGKEGITTSTLRPSGAAEFDGIKLDVVSEGEFIPKGTKVKIINVAGRRVVVREVK
ncbi:MAG: hypothetical protein PWP27_2406 [Clostridiales bacterium]|nr:hypothetical protein [Clostridiales bacterium]MDK2934596.1 hypothetical protein [Clostridiales bacterium]